MYGDKKMDEQEKSTCAEQTESIKEEKTSVWDRHKKLLIFMSILLLRPTQNILQRRSIPY